MDVIPMVLNGAIGANLHVNFAVASRSSFGFYLSRVAVVIRMVTALFWHGMLLCASLHSPTSRTTAYHPSSYPDLHRIDCYDANHPCHMAFILEHPQHDPSVSWHHDSADVLSRVVLESSIPLPPHSAS
jgi:hypothetical protein